jgi:adenylate cyclase
MAVSLKELNENLRNDLPESLRIGIGVHVGSAVGGDIGYAEAQLVTVIGVPVNTASRLETINKGCTSQLIVSEKVTAHAWLDLSAQRSESVAVSGRAEPLKVCILNDAADIRGLVEA